jgi:hypothetical protein
MFMGKRHLIAGDVRYQFVPNLVSITLTLRSDIALLNEQGEISDQGNWNSRTVNWSSRDGAILKKGRSTGITKLVEVLRLV